MKTATAILTTTKTDETTATSVMSSSTISTKSINVSSVPTESPATSLPKSCSYRIVALYKFVNPKLSVDSLPILKSEIEVECNKYKCRGTLLLAEEGINGTICYPYSERDNNNGNNDDKLIQFLQSKFNNGLRTRVSSINDVDKPVFNRFKVKIKSNIVTLFPSNTSRSKYVVAEAAKREDQNQLQRQEEESNEGAIVNTNVEDIIKDSYTTSNNDTEISNIIPSWWSNSTDPTQTVGEYVTPEEWNELLDDPDCLVIDTRNEYEIKLGTFRNAINPHTECFTEFPNWMKQNLITKEENGEAIESNDIGINGESSKQEKFQQQEEQKRRKPKKIAMFCKYSC